MIATGVITPFLIPVKIAAHGGASWSVLPYVLYQGGPSSRPGLYAHEKRLVLPLVVSSTLLFFAGHGVLLLLRLRRRCSRSSTASRRRASRWRRTSRRTSISCSTMFLAFGVTFEMPVVVVVLVRTGIVTVEQLREWRGYVIVGAFVDRGGRDAARRGVAARARDPDVPALRGRASSSAQFIERAAARPRPRPPRADAERVAASLLGVAGAAGACRRSRRASSSWLRRTTFTGTDLPGLHLGDRC